jgi:hypothetical protein
MLAAEQYRFRQEWCRPGTLLTFHGLLSEGILFALGDALKKRLARDGTGACTVKRVFSVFVEQVQNILRYSAETTARTGQDVDRLSTGLISVGCEQGRFCLVAGNLMRHEDVPALQARLVRLQGLDSAGLKACYLERIRETVEPVGKGAGLGLIEIARRASEPIQSDFLAVDAATAFYCMKVFV